MQALNSQPATGSNPSGPIAWNAVPDFIRKALTTQGCTLLKHRRERPLSAPHIRFQYAPLAYQGDLYYLQRWSQHEWGVCPSQIIFPKEGACSMAVLSNGNLLSQLTKTAVARFYGNFPDNVPLQPLSKQYNDKNILPLAG